MQLNDLIYLGRRLAQVGQLAMHEDTPDLVGAEPRVLADLMDRRFSTVTEISQRTGYTQGRISTAVATLRDAGLLGTRPDMSDRRKTVIFATSLAEEHASPLRHRSAEGLLAELLADMDATERDGIEHALDSLLERLRLTDSSTRDRPASA